MAKVIRVSQEVYDKIASEGKFGESVDDVLRRLLGVE
jgi:negative regulator of replication initiation